MALVTFTNAWKVLKINIESGIYVINVLLLERFTEMGYRFVCTFSHAFLAQHAHTKVSLLVRSEVAN